MHVQQNVAIECLAISTSLVKWLFSSLSLVPFFPFHSVFRPMGSCVFNHCFLWLQQALHCTVAVVAFALFYFFRFYFVHSAHTVAWWLCESVHTGTFKRLTGWLVGWLSVLPMHWHFFLLIAHSILHDTSETDTKSPPPNGIK